MKTFELSSKESKDGMRNFSLVLHEIYPESSFDDINGIATKTNSNGIGWREKWTSKTKDTIVGKSLKCEFLDDDRSLIGGHGETGIGDDMLPEFCDATVVGHFTSSEIRNIEYDDGVVRKVLVGNGEIDAQCYPAFVRALEESISAGNDIHGSVEIMKTADNPAIVYEYGYHKDQRIPKEYQYSGYAILGIKEADPSAILLELNSETTKEETQTMNETEIKALITQVVTEMNACKQKMDEANAACKKEIDEANAACAKKEKECNEAVAAITAEKEEAIASSEKIKAALEAAQNELSEKYKEIEELYAELERLRKELGIAKANERISEMNSAIADFSDEEKAFAKDELDAFNVDPMTVEINSVVSKIYEGIGKKAKEDAAAIVSEINSVGVEDIFGGIEAHEPAGEDVSIF